MHLSHGIVVLHLTCCATVPNVYILIGYNSISGTTLSDPIIKLLPLTNASSSHEYFSNTRNSSSNNIIFPPIGTGSVGQNNGNGTKVSYTTVTVTHTPTTVVWLGSPTANTPNSNSDSGSISNNKGTQNEKAFGALDALDSSSTPSADTGPKGGLADQVSIFPLPPRHRYEKCAHGCLYVPSSNIVCLQSFSEPLSLASF